MGIFGPSSGEIDALQKAAELAQRVAELEAERDSVPSPTGLEQEQIGVKAGYVSHIVKIAERLYEQGERSPETEISAGFAAETVMRARVSDEVIARRVDSLIDLDEIGLRMRVDTPEFQAECGERTAELLARLREVLKDENIYKDFEIILRRITVDAAAIRLLAQDAQSRVLPLLGRPDEKAKIAAEARQQLNEAVGGDAFARQEAELRQTAREAWKKLAIEFAKAKIIAQLKGEAVPAIEDFAQQWIDSVEGARFRQQQERDSNHDLTPVPEDTVGPRKYIPTNRRS